MVDGIGLALTSIKSVSETLKALAELRDIAKVSEITIDLQAKIGAAQQLALAAQQEQTALITTIENLKKEIMQFENWEAEKQRYELDSLPPGVMVYRLKVGMENGEPPHKICANCYNKGKKSFLHTRPASHGRTFMKCDECNDEKLTGLPVTERTSGSRTSGYW